MACVTISTCRLPKHSTDSLPLTQSSPIQVPETSSGHTPISGRELDEMDGLALKIRTRKHLVHASALRTALTTRPCCVEAMESSTNHLRKDPSQTRMDWDSSIGRQ